MLLKLHFHLNPLSDNVEYGDVTCSGYSASYRQNP